MIQTINQLKVFDVDFDTMPTLPILGNCWEECIYAEILTDALEKGIIVEPGKYGLYHNPDVEKQYEIFKIIE